MQFFYVLLISLTTISLNGMDNIPFYKSLEEKKALIKSVEENMSAEQKKQVCLGEVQGIYADSIPRFGTWHQRVKNLPSGDNYFTSPLMNAILPSLDKEHIVKKFTCENENYEIIIYDGNSLTLEPYCEIDSTKDTTLDCYIAVCFLQNHRIVPIARFLFGKYTNQEDQTLCAAILENNIRHVPQEFYLGKAYYETLREVENYAKNLGCKKIKLAGCTRIENNQYHYALGYKDRCTKTLE